MTIKTYVSSIIFCEDLRIESSGKEIAIGIFPGGISVSNTPHVVQNLVIRFEFNFRGEITEFVHILMKDPLGNEMFQQIFPITFLNWKMPGAAAMSIQNFIFPVPGEYNVLTRLNEDQDWQIQSNFYLEKTTQVEIKRRAKIFSEQMNNEN